MNACALSAEEAVRAVAPMASLALALLAFFTNLRREALAGYRDRVSPLGRETVVAALPDIALSLFTVAAVIAMAPLCFQAFDLGEVGSAAGAVGSMFGLVWIGFVALLLFQLWMLATRFHASYQAGK